MSDCIQNDLCMTSFHEAVYKQSTRLPEGVDTKVKGYEFNNGLDYDKLFASYASTGFQAMHLSRAINIINAMIDRKSDLPAELNSESINTMEELGLGHCRKSGCTIFLAYTSNMVTCGVREIIRYLAEHRMIDILVTSAGGIEEDLIKCMGDFYIGDFYRWNGANLRQLGINRTGNLLVPNDNYVKFEEWLLPIFDKLLEEQNEKNFNWTPSKMIDRLGKEINNTESIYYWCHKNGIPVFCPAFTDGALGDVLFEHTYRSPGLRVDLVEDIRKINTSAIYSYATGAIILGGGIVKHHTLNANLMRNGADYCVYVNTGNEFDGSDAGARTDEAISWGKIKSTNEPIKVHADASLVFPIIVAQTFAKRAKATQ